MFWTKRKLPKPDVAQELVEEAHDLISKLMYGSYSMPAHLSEGLHKFLYDYEMAGKDIYAKEPK